MAGTLPIEEFVTCQICFELYVEPQSLSCRHTLCKKCVRKLKSGSKIQCPMCQTFSDTKDIKPDYNIISLMDLYKQQEKEILDQDDEEEVNNPKLCKACKDPLKNVTSLCADCKQFMCKDCEAAHRGIPSLKKHVVKTMDEVASDIRITLNESKSKLNSRKDFLLKKQNKILDELTKLNLVEEECLEEITKSEEEYVGHVVEHYEGLRDQVKQRKHDERDKLKAVEKLVMAHLCDITDKLGVVTKVVHKEEPLAVVESGILLAEEMKRGMPIETYRDIPDDHDIEVNFTANVTEGTGFEPTSAGQVNLHINNHRDSPKHQPWEVMSHSPVDESTQRGNLLQMASGLYENRKCVPLDFPSKKLLLIRDYLWCVGSDLVNVYNKHLQIVKTIQLQNVNNVTGLAILDAQKMLVACSVKKSLQILDIHGKFETTLTKGCFSEVIRQGHLVYVLDYNHCKIYVFRTVGGTLLPSKMFKLQFSNGAECDSLYVKDGNVYVCSWNNHCIYLHKDNGELIGKFGKSGSSGAGLLKNPRISMVDFHGNILTADCGNHRVQVLDIVTSTWKVISIEDTTIGWPYDVIVDDGIKTIWVLDYKSIFRLKRKE